VEGSKKVTKQGIKAVLYKSIPLDQSDQASRARPRLKVETKDTLCICPLVQYAYIWDDAQEFT
jgi:hypothetical protein